MSDDTRNKYFSNSELPETALSTKALEGLGVGSAIGGALGGLAAAVAAMGTILTIPGLGLVIAGPLAAGLAGAGAWRYCWWSNRCFSRIRYSRAAGKRIRDAIRAVL